MLIKTRTGFYEFFLFQLRLLVSEISLAALFLSAYRQGLGGVI